MTEMTGWLGLLSTLSSSCRKLAWACSHASRKFPSSKTGRTPFFSSLLALFSNVKLVKARSMAKPRFKGQRNRLFFLIERCINHCEFFFFPKNLPHRMDTLLTEIHSAKLPSGKTIAIYSFNSCLYFIISQKLLSWW